MPTISMANKDFTEWYKNYVAEGQSVSLWEQALTGLQAAYQPQISAVQQTSAYDISQAYANYKKSQLNLLQSQRLGTGLKEQLSSGLGQQYQSAYQQAKATEAQKLASITGAYAEDVATVEKQFSQFGETASQLQKALFEYAGEYENTEYDFNRAFLPESEGGLGFYVQSEDGTYQLTEKGETFYDKVLNQYLTTYDKTTGERLTTGFGDWLMENKDYAELGKAYSENPALFAEAFGGKNVSDLEITRDEADFRQKVIDAGGSLKEGETYEQAYNRLLTDASNNINNTKNILKELKVYEDASGYARLKDDAAVRKALSVELGISENNINTNSYNDKSISRTKALLIIDVDAKNLTSKQKLALKESGFKDVDGKLRYSMLPNTSGNIHETFAR